MKRKWIASSIFNLVFFCVTAFMCVVCLPLLLLPSHYAIGAIKLWIHITTMLERHILGLRYEIRGAQNLPQVGAFLVAAKHQSAYETFKLHVLLDNPAIILKKELLRIPLWGTYLKKSDVIAIDRSTPERALKSIEDGALRVAAQGRPIVIFPQGTRVRPEHSTVDKPYKPGIARIQAATGLPIIPLALNTGLFWPRSGWLKSGGMVIFEFLDPIEAGQNRKALMHNLEEKIENSSSRLMNEAQISAIENEKPPLIKKERKKRSPLPLLIALLLLFIGYSVLWFKIADEVKSTYIREVQNFVQIQDTGIPVISGFPGKINLDVLQQEIQTEELYIKAQLIHAESWPWIFSPKMLIDRFQMNKQQEISRSEDAVLNVEEIRKQEQLSLFTPIMITTGPITIRHIKWPQPLVFSSLDLELTIQNSILNIVESAIKKENFTGSIKGNVDFNTQPFPTPDLTASLYNYSALLNHLAENRIIKPRAALFMGAGFAALADSNGVVRVPVTLRGQRIYAGPLPVVYLPE